MTAFVCGAIIGLTIGAMLVDIYHSNARLRRLERSIDDLERRVKASGVSVSEGEG